jgi:hypothetical protein
MASWGERKSPPCDFTVTTALPNWKIAAMIACVMLKAEIHVSLPRAHRTCAAHLIDPGKQMAGQTAGRQSMPGAAEAAAYSWVFW